MNRGNIGGGVAMIVIGLVLALAISVDQVDVVNINLIGWIMVAAGVLLVLWGMFNSQRTSSSSTTVQHRDGTVEQRTTETSHDDPVA